MTTAEKNHESTKSPSPPLSPPIHTTRKLQNRGERKGWCFFFFTHLSFCSVAMDSPPPLRTGNSLRRGNAFTEEPFLSSPPAWMPPPPLPLPPPPFAPPPRAAAGFSWFRSVDDGRTGGRWWHNIFQEEGNIHKKNKRSDKSFPKYWYRVLELCVTLKVKKYCMAFV